MSLSVRLRSPALVFHPCSWSRYSNLVGGRTTKVTRKQKLESDPYSEFRRRLKTLAGDKPLEFASRIRLAPSDLNTYVQGKRNPDFALHRRLYGAGVDLHWLRTGEPGTVIPPVEDEEWWNEFDDEEYLNWEEHLLQKFAVESLTLTNDHIRFLSTMLQLPDPERIYLAVRRDLDQDGKPDLTSPPTVLAVCEGHKKAAAFIEDSKRDAVYPQGVFLTLFGLNGRKALAWHALSNGNAIGVACPYCRSEFAAGDSIEFCWKCSAVHHTPCWNELGHCCCHGCNSRNHRTGTLRESGVPAPKHVAKRR